MAVAVLWQVFKFVIVASGIFAEPNVTIPGIESFPGLIFHLFP